jgi:hypothetical protein
MEMIRRLLTVPLLTVLIAALLGVGATTPTRAYGHDNWQIGISATGVASGTGTGLGFWGWFAFGGGVTSGNTGDGQFAQYVHDPAGSGFTCHISLDITSWTVTNGTFFITGTASATPAAETTPCLAFFPGSSNFASVNTLIPAAPGHYDLGGLGPGLTGEFQIQVSQVG